MDRFRFLRLPFGLNLVLDVFLERMDTMLQGLKGAINISNDTSDTLYHDNIERLNLYLLALNAMIQELWSNLQPGKIKHSKSYPSLASPIYIYGTISPDPERTPQFLGCRNSCVAIYKENGKSSSIL